MIGYQEQRGVLFFQLLLLGGCMSSISIIILRTWQKYELIHPTAVVYSLEYHTRLPGRTNSIGRSIFWARFWAPDLMSSLADLRRSTTTYPSTRNRARNSLRNTCFNFWKITAGFHVKLYDYTPVTYFPTSPSYTVKFKNS